MYGNDVIFPFKNNSKPFLSFGAINKREEIY